MIKYLLAALLIVSSCRSAEQRAKLAQQRQAEKEMEILDEARSVLEKNPEWKKQLAGPPRVDTVIIPRVEVQTKILTRVDTQLLIEYVDTITNKLSGQIDYLQAQVLKSTLMDMASKMSTKALPDTTVRFPRLLVVEIAGKQIRVQDTVSLRIASEGNGYVFKVGNQAKHIPVETQTNQVSVAPARRLADKFYDHKEFWFAVVALLLTALVRFKS